MHPRSTSRPCFVAVQVTWGDLRICGCAIVTHNSFVLQKNTIDELYTTTALDHVNT